MKKAALYARVSSDAQRKENTVESQVLAIKEQIREAGDVLVKEYVDNGFSGARLDRPAMDQLRRDLKSDRFDAVYFHSADRIARDGLLQNLIIAEILKAGKQLVIDGRDYVNNPENKFSLTVLGAVAELERAKIVERSSRGRQLRLAQGYLAGCGVRRYGYDYHRRTPDSAQRMVINEGEARVVRSMFTAYGEKGVSMRRLVKQLEDSGARTKRGGRVWRFSLVKHMLSSRAYAGTMYFNTVRSVREYANPFSGVRQTSRRLVRRDRGEWVGVKIPAIVSQQLWDKVQARLAENRERYSIPKRVQLLSRLIVCGGCGHKFFAYQGFTMKRPKTRPPHPYFRRVYKCTWRLRQGWHSRKTELDRCHVRAIKAEALEAQVFGVVENTILVPEELREHMDFFRDSNRAALRRMERRVREVGQKIKTKEQEKRRIVDLYARGELGRVAYVRKSQTYDQVIQGLRMQQAEAMQRMPLLRQTELVNTIVEQYCEAAKVRYAKCSDFETKRQFLLDYIEKIIFLDEKITVCGSVPVKSPEGESKVDFKITDYSDYRPNGRCRTG